MVFTYKILLAISWHLAKQVLHLKLRWNVNLVRCLKLSTLQVTLGTEADPVSKVKEGDFSNIWQSTSHNSFATVRGMKCTTQHCCDKTMDDKMAFKSRMLFFEFSKIMLNKVAFLGFRSDDRSPWIRYPIHRFQGYFCKITLAPFHSPLKIRKCHRSTGF